MRLGDEAQRHRRRDIGMAQRLAEPIGRGAAGAVTFERGERRRYLAAAALRPDCRDLLVQPQFVEQADRLLGRAHREREDGEDLAPQRTAARAKRAFRPDEIVERIDHTGAVDEHLAIVEHQGRHPHQRVEGADLLAIGENGPRAMLERQAVERERDADAAHEGRIILADQDHRALSVHHLPNRQQADHLPGVTAAPQC